MKRSIVLLAAALCFMVFAAGPARANTTVITWLSDDATFPVRDCGFKIMFHAYGPYKAADQYDNDGVLFRTIVTSGGGGYHISATANGVTLTTQSSYQIIVTYKPNGRLASIREDGLHFGFHVPGEGVVLLDTGRVDFDPKTGEVIFESGPRQFLNGDIKEFCAAFE
jgi:hypothetical protein